MKKQSTKEGRLLNLQNIIRGQGKHCMMSLGCEVVSLAKKQHKTIEILNENIDKLKSKIIELESLVEKLKNQSC